MKKNVLLGIGVICFALLLFLGPIWTFSRVEAKLLEATSDVASFQSLADGSIEFHGRTGYLTVPSNISEKEAEGVSQDIGNLTGVRKVKIIYSEVATQEPQIPETAETQESQDVKVEEGADANEETDNEKDVATDTEVQNQGDVDTGENTEVVEDEVQVEINDILSSQTIEFENGTSTLTEEANGIMVALAEVLSENEDVKLLIVGYTDSNGSEANNLALSQRRAESVKEALIAQGIDGSRLTAEGRGEADPIATNETAEGRQQNRRVEMIKQED